MPDGLLAPSPDPLPRAFVHVEDEQLGDDLDPPDRHRELDFSGERQDDENRGGGGDDTLTQ